MVSGAPRSYRHLHADFRGAGQKTFRIAIDPRREPGQAERNFLIAAVIESLGEAIALVSKAALTSTNTWRCSLRRSLLARCTKIMGHDRRPEVRAAAGFAAPAGRRIYALTLAAAEALRVPMPLASLLRDRFSR